MKKKDFIIIGAVLLLAVLLIPLTNYIQSANKADADYLYIYVNDELYDAVRLGTEQDVTVDQGNGKVNVVHVTRTGAYMESSTCENQDCVGQGEVNLENWESRPLKYWIVCLPNGVTLELRPGGELGE